MRWIRYTVAGRTVYGLVEGDQIAEVAGDPFDGWQATNIRHALAAVHIELPVVPPTFYCVGLNYEQHVRLAAKRLGIEAKLPEKPDVGYGLCFATSKTTFERLSLKPAKELLDWEPADDIATIPALA